MEQLSVKMKGIENEEEVNKEKLDKLLQWLLAKQGLVYITSGRVEATSGRLEGTTSHIGSLSVTDGVTSSIFVNQKSFLERPKRETIPITKC